MYNIILFGKQNATIASCCCVPDDHESRDGVITIQMYSSTSTITLNMHEYEYSENKCTRVQVRLLYNVLKYEYDYIRM